MYLRYIIMLVSVSGVVIYVSNINVSWLEGLVCWEASELTLTILHSL